MGRVFTTMFEFKHEQHIAMVTVSEEPNGPAHFYVQLFNQELYHLIPEGKFQFASTDNLPPASIQNRVAAELFQSVKTAIYKHLCPRTTTENEEMVNETKHDSDTDKRL